MMRPSFTMTAPTIGLGATYPSPLLQAVMPVSYIVRLDCLPYAALLTKSLE